MRKVFIKTLLKFGLVLLLVFVLQNEPPKRSEAYKVEPPKPAVTTATVSQSQVAPTVTPAPTVSQQPASPPPQPKVALVGTKYDWMRAAGIPESEWGAVDYIVSRESGWCPTKWNGDYGACPADFIPKYSVSANKAYGLCQSLPAIKMASMGADYLTNPVTQLKWCNSYAIKKGGWTQSMQFWMNNHWW